MAAKNSVRNAESAGIALNGFASNGSTHKSNTNGVPTSEHDDPDPQAIEAIESNESGTTFVKNKRRNQVLVIIACFFLTFTGCGANFAFGVYQEQYTSLSDVSGSPFEGVSPGDIDLIGNLSASLMSIFAPFTSIWTERYGALRVSVLGGFLFALAGVLASFGEHLWHFILAQGVLQGVAACFMYIPAMTVSPKCFEGRRALAVGIIAGGTGIGGLTFAPVLRALIESVGFRNTVRTAGCVAFLIILASAILLDRALSNLQTESEKINQKNKGKRTLVLPKFDWKTIRTKAFLSHASGSAFQSAAYFLPIFYFSSYARNLGLSSADGANIIAVSNASNFIGKIITGLFADRYGRFNALFISTFISAAVTWILWGVSQSSISLTGYQVIFWLYAAIYGASAGAYVSLFPVALVEQFGRAKFEDINGLMYMVRGLGTFVGTYVGGVFAKENLVDGVVNVNLNNTFLFVAICLSLASGVAIWSKMIFRWSHVKS